MESNLTSLSHPVKFNCNPTENNASGTRVTAILSSKELTGDISTKRGKTSAVTNATKGGKLNNLLSTNRAFRFSVPEAFMAIITPAVDISTKVTWSHITAILNAAAP